MLFAPLLLSVFIRLFANVYVQIVGRYIDAPQQTSSLRFRFHRAETQNSRPPIRPGFCGITFSSASMCRRKRMILSIRFWPSVDRTHRETANQAKRICICRAPRGLLSTQRSFSASLSTTDPHQRPNQTCDDVVHEPTQEKMMSVLGKLPEKNGPSASSNVITRTFLFCD